MSEPTIHRPADAAQLREIVAWAVAEEQPLEIAGNGTKRILGRPVEAEHLVSLASLRGHHALRAGRAGDVGAAPARRWP